MKKRIVIIIAVVVLVVVGLTGFNIYRRIQAARAAVQNFETAEIQLGPLAATVDAAGTVRSNQSAILNWQTSGKIAQVHVQVGDQVKGGDVMAELERTSLAQNVILAQADLYSAQQALKDLQNYAMQSAQAQQELQNAQDNLDKLLHPDVSLELAQAKVSLLDAQDALDTAVKDRQRLNYKRCEDSTVQSYEAQYYLALDRYQNYEEIYKGKYASLPDTNPDRLNALATLLDLDEKVQRALINLNWCKGTATQAEIAEADAKVALAQEQVDNFQTQISDLQAGPKGVDIALAEARLTEAQQNYDDIKDGPSADQLAAAEARVAAAQATLNLVKITAPFNGVITMVQNKPGDQVSPGVQAFRIDDLSHILVDVEVSEVDINQIKVGQQVVLSFDAIIGKEYHGQVTEVGLAGTQTQGVVSFKLTTQMTDADEQVLPGMTGAVSIIVSQVDNALLVPTEAIRVVDGQRVVYVLGEAPAGTEDQSGSRSGPFGMGSNAAPAGTKMVPITLGATSFAYCQVIGGDLKVGDQVILNPPDTFQFGPGGGGAFGR